MRWGGFIHQRKCAKAQPWSALPAVEPPGDLFAAFVAFFFWVGGGGWGVKKWRLWYDSTVTGFILSFKNLTYLFGPAIEMWLDLLAQNEGQFRKGQMDESKMMGLSPDGYGIWVQVGTGVPFNPGDLITVAGCRTGLCVARTQPERCECATRWGARHKLGLLTYLQIKVLTTRLLMSNAVRGLCLWPKYSPALLKYLQTPDVAPAVPVSSVSTEKRLMWLSEKKRKTRGVMIRCTFFGQ